MHDYRYLFLLSARKFCEEPWLGRGRFYSRCGCNFNYGLRKRFPQTKGIQSVRVWGDVWLRLSLPSYTAADFFQLLKNAKLFSVHILQALFTVYFFGGCRKSCAISRRYVAQHGKHLDMYALLRVSRMVAPRRLIFLKSQVFPTAALISRRFSS